MKIKAPIFSYQQFITWVSELVANKKTSGNNQSEALIGFTALNQKRMERIYKTTQISETLTSILLNIKEKQTWYVITEAWCGDSAQSLPVIAKLADLAGEKVRLSIFLRDENPEWIEKYHTNGSKSIPKLISFDESGRELFTWGPRPKEAQEILLEWKANPHGRTWEDFEKELHTWYAKDKTIAIQTEFEEILKQ
ncbi:MAG: thioredoxin family protein [Thermoflexibacter sp.]|jgi:hypothetical protein|nr:thioredoxin family protein [Thermoflexibacter sp.]